MKIEHWLVPGIWLALLLSLGILLYTGHRSQLLLEGNSFSVRGEDSSSLTVVTDNQQRITIALRKRFTLGEESFLRAVATYFNADVVGANAYQFQLPANSCEFSAGLLVYCESQRVRADALNKFYAISWWSDKKLLLQLTSEQLTAQGLTLSFRTSRERRSVLGSGGKMKGHCLLQAHLQVTVNKSPQENASMKTEDVFFILSDQACTV